MTGHDANFLPLPSGEQHALPAIRMGPEPRLLAAARRTARCAAALLRSIKAPLLTVVRDMSCEPMRVRVLPWSDRLVPGDELDTLMHDPAAGLRPLIAPLAFSGAETCRLLSLRWPANAAPPVISIVTDGTGVAMSPGHPAVPFPAGRRARTAIILPFDEIGPWAMLSDRAITTAH